MYVREGVGPQGLGEGAVVARQTLEDKETVSGVHSAGRRVQQVGGGRGTALEAVGGSGHPRVIITVDKTQSHQNKVVTTLTAIHGCLMLQCIKNIFAHNKINIIHNSQNIHARREQCKLICLVLRDGISLFSFER